MINMPLHATPVGLAPGPEALLAALRHYQVFVRSSLLSRSQSC